MRNTASSEVTAGETEAAEVTEAEEPITKFTGDRTKEFQPSQDPVVQEPIGTRKEENLKGGGDEVS